MKVVYVKDTKKKGIYFTKYEEFADRYSLADIIEWCETFSPDWEVEIRTEHKELLWKRV